MPSEDLCRRGGDKRPDGLPRLILAVHQSGLVDGAAYLAHGFVGYIGQSHYAGVISNQLHAETSMI
jgi:hypothetical protein